MNFAAALRSLGPRPPRQWLSTSKPATSTGSTAGKSRAARKCKARKCWKQSGKIEQLTRANDFKERTRNSLTAAIQEEELCVAFDEKLKEDFCIRDELDSGVNLGSRVDIHKENLLSDNSILDVFFERQTSAIQHYEARTANFYLHNCGFIPDIKPARKNREEIIEKISLNEHYSVNNNMSCYDLTTSVKPPSNFKYLLRLGEKFCPQSKTSKEKSINEMLEKSKKDVRMKRFVHETHRELEGLKPRLYIKNPMQNPPRAMGPMEECIIAFKKKILTEHNKRKWRKGSNLSFIQNQIL